MKLVRPGIPLPNDGSHLAIMLNPSARRLSHLKPFASDILITVNEVTASGSVKLGLWLPQFFTFKSIEGRSNLVPKTNRLNLTRFPGTSVVIRKRDDISIKSAMDDLLTNSISIYNDTQSLSHSKHKTGASLSFRATESVWKVVRLELTLMRKEYEL